MKNIEKSTLTEENTTENKEGSLEDKYAILEQENEELKAKVKFYEEQFRLSQAKKYGASSEKLDPEQISIFNEAEKLSVQQSQEPKMEEIIKRRKSSSSKSRKTYEDLPVEEVYYSLSEEEQVCPTCENTLHEMKTEVRKELKIIPAQVKVVHHIKQFYACRRCDQEGTNGTIVSAPMPKPVLSGSMVSPSLLAFIMEKKYNQALPLYRQEKSFIDFGIDISRQNMANWIISGAETWLKPLYDRLHEKLLKEPIIHADETVLNVLDEKNNKNNYMWLYASAKCGNQSIYLYDYQKSRANRHPKTFLDGFDGYLQTDGYSGYNKIQDITQVGCLAHARRKFDEAIKALPKDAEVTKTKAQKGLLFFTEIYKLEKMYANQAPEERYKNRLKNTKPILDELYEWLMIEPKRTLPKSKLGVAIKYSIKQWPKLIGFLADGRLAVDNNLAERAIKPFVIGRKNFLFSKSPKGATASGICYSIIETAKANNLKPFQYLTYLFEKLPNIDLENQDELDALLPWAESIPDEFINKTEKDKK